MNLENHINPDVYNNSLAELKQLYHEQIPSSFFMFLIGATASIIFILFDKSVAGKNAGNLLQSMASGLSQFKIFVAVSIFLLTISSLSKFNLNFTKDEHHILERSSLANIAVKGMFSFLAPYSAMLFAMFLIMLSCLKIIPNIAQLQEINLKITGTLFFSAFIIHIFLGMFYFISKIENFARSKVALLLVSFTFFMLFIVSIFDIAK